MVKIAWLYHAANGAPQRRKIIARQRAFHGSTIFAASLTGLPHMHREFGLPLEGVVHTLCPNPYREQRKDETTGAFVERLANELEALILAEELIGSLHLSQSRSMLAPVSSCRHQAISNVSGGSR